MNDLTGFPLSVVRFSLSDCAPIPPKLLKKAQGQGGSLQADRGVLEVRRSERRGGPTS
jgi:hypothetical protein